MGKRQDAALETKYKIIKAINELLKEKSLNDISIEEITTKAKVAKGSFYTHFKRKEDAACYSTLDKYDSIKEESFNLENSVYKNLCIYLSESIKIIEKYSLKTAQIWMKSVSDPIDDENRGVVKYSYDFDNIKYIIDNGIKRGELIKDTPINELTEIIMNSYYGAVINWCITNGKSNITRNIDFYCNYDLKSLIKNYKEEK